MKYHRSMINVVEEGLYIGDAEAASQLILIQQLGIEIIVSLGNEKELKSYKYFDDIEYLKIEIEDNENENIEQYFDLCNQFISLGNVLIHCHKGISRSATIIIAYLMYTYKNPFDVSFSKLKSIRQFILPNEGFIKQLKEMKKKLKILNNNKFFQNLC